jgi:hypothetical protein
MDRLDEVRSQVLARIDAAERHYRLAFFGGAALELAFLTLFLLLADLSNRLHLLLLLTGVMTYSIIILGLVALGVHVTRTSLRVLRAIDATRGPGPDAG